MKKNRSRIIDKSTTLFPNEEIFHRESVDQIEIERIIRPLANQLALVVNAAMISLNIICENHPNCARDRNFKATNFNSFVYEEIVKTGCFETGKLKQTGRNYVKIDKYMLFIKKVGDDLSPSHNSTKTVLLYENQLTDNCNDTLPVLYLGYSVTPSWQSVKGIYIVCLSGKKIEWFTDISLNNEDLVQTRINSLQRDLTEPNVKLKESVAIKKAQ